MIPVSRAMLLVAEGINLDVLVWWWWYWRVEIKSEGRASKPVGEQNKIVSD